MSSKPESLSEEQYKNLKDAVRKELSEELTGTNVDLFQGFKHKMFNNLHAEEVAQVMRQFLTNLTTKTEYIEKLESVKEMDIVQCVISVLIDDGFISSNSNDKLFQIEYVPKDASKTLQSKINTEIAEFLEAVDLSSLVADILEDLLLYGEYHLRTVAKEGKGITEFVDDIDPADVLPIYKKNIPSFYLISRSGSRGGGYYNQNRSIIRVEPDQVATFIMSKKKVRLRVDAHFANKKQMPEHIRMGQSCIYPVLGRLQQLQLTEIASKISSLKEMVMPNVVSVGIPANTSPKDLKEITNSYEDSLNAMLNEAFTSMRHDPQSFEEVVSRLSASGVRVLPNFSDQKGALSQIDLGTSEARRLKDDGEDSVRLKIARALAIPSHYINPETGKGDGKMSDLKTFSRYTRKLLSLQEGVAFSLKRLVAQHLSLKGKKISENDLLVSFKSLVDMDLLDTMEFTVASVEVLSSFFRLIDEITRSPLNIQFDAEVVRKILLKFLVPLKADQDLIKKIEKGQDVATMAGNVGEYVQQQQQVAPEEGYE